MDEERLDEIRAYIVDYDMCTKGMYNNAAFAEFALDAITDLLAEVERLRADKAKLKKAIAMGYDASWAKEE